MRARRDGLETAGDDGRCGIHLPRLENLPSPERPAIGPLYVACTSPALTVSSARYRAVTGVSCQSDIRAVWLKPRLMPGRA
jgi:hypothetical protein